MAASFTCPTCGRTGQIPEGFTGKKVRCPACKTVSSLDDDTIPLAPEPVRPPSPASALRVPTPPVPPSRDEDDEPSGPPVVLLAGVGAAVLLVALSGGVGWWMSRGSSAPANAPQAQAPVAAAPAPAAPEAAPKSPAQPEPEVAAAAAAAVADAVNKPSSAPPPAPAPVKVAASEPSATPAETIRRVKDATVYLRVRAGRAQGSGSGFVIRAEGDTLLVATNHHVVNPHMERDEDDADPRLAGIRPVVTAVFRSGTGPGQEQTVPAQVIAQERDGNRDLAILRVRGVKNPPEPIPFPENPDLTETTPVLIYGFPFGNLDKMLDRSAQGNPSVTINKGSVSSLRHDARGKVSYVQIDGSLNPGNSGGPVVDEKGRLVGVSVSVISNTTIGFAIPPGELSRMLDGKVGRLSLAFRGQNAGAANLQAGRG
jgi:S1-C subfamily serine protease